jgi:pSer/pThr/pTyr-binding forkhead associated (FHA) protein
MRQASTLGPWAGKITAVAVGIDVLPSLITVLCLMAVVIMLTTSQLSYATKLQVLSAQENPAGAVTVTLAIFAGVVPKASDVQLRFGEKTVIKAEEVKAVAPDVLQTSIIIAVDQSGSMGAGQIKDIRDAAMRVLSQPAPRVNVALWTFDTDVKELHEFSPNPAELTKSVSQIGLQSLRDGKTKLYDSIALALSRLRNYEVQGPKRLILITDGKDDGSSINDQVVIKEANAKGVTIDAIGYGNVSSAGSDLLGRLAKNTAGHYVPAEGSKQLFTELQKLLSLPPPRAFDVLFRYQVSDDKRLLNSAQLEFWPSGQSAIVLPIEQELSAPRSSPTAVTAPPPNGGVDKKILLGVLAAVLTLFAAYLLIRKKEAPKPELPERPEIPPAPPPIKPSESPKSNRDRTKIRFVFPPPGEGRAAAHLAGISGLAKGRRFAIEQVVCHIGSGNENELQVGDDYVSAKHAVIRYDSGSLYLTDSGSRNGTFLNETKLGDTAMALSPGDQIRIGRTTFELETGAIQAGRVDHNDRGNRGETIVP